MSYRTLSLLLLSTSISLLAAPERQRFGVYLGGSGADNGRAVALDSNGNAYIAGQTARGAGRMSAFIAKTNASGSEILWTSYLAGDSADAVAIDGSGNVWVAGNGFLAKLSAADGRVERTLETARIAGLAVDGAGAIYAAGDGFVEKFEGFERVYSAKIAANVRGVAVDGKGGAYVVYANSISRLAADGAGFDYTFDLGWPAAAVAVDGSGAAYVTGANARVAKVTPAGDAYAFRVELGGVLEQEGSGIALDAAGNIYVSGWTNSSDFAKSRGWNGERDGFLVRLNGTGDILEVNFAGTAARDALNSVAVTPAGDAYVAGWTEGSGLGSGPLAQLQGATDALLIKFGGEGNRAATGTTTSLTVSPAGAAAYGQLVVLTATVTPAGGTGKVTFYDGAAVVGIGTLSGTTATATTILLPTGTRTLRAFYAGDVNFSASTSANVALTVNVTPSLALSQVGGTTTAVGASPIATGVADFNEDGRADVALVSTAGNTLTILLSNGSGGFTNGPGSPYPTGAGAASLTVNDFNGDGRADVAVGNLNTNNVSVFLGTGTGGFTAAAGSPVGLGAGPLSITSADFNGDGNVDFVTANFVTGGVILMLGNGAGGFTAASGSPFPTGGGAASVTSGDFNNDGKADVAVANFTGGSVSILLGNGAGGFTNAAGSPITGGGGAPSMVMSADFNADGRADLAVVNLNGASVAILLGNGTGGFSTAAGSPVAAGASPRSVDTLDYNGDGKLDLAVVSPNDGLVSILQGNGVGGFTPAPGSPFGGYGAPAALAVGDFTGDGRVDIAVANSGTNNVSTILGVGAIPLVVSGTPPSPTNTPQTITFLTRDTDGFANISRLYFLVNTTDSIPQNSCHGFYDRAGNLFYLYNDALTVLQGPLAAGSGGTLQNGQCILYGAGSGLVSGAGTDLTVNIRMGMLGLYATTTEKIYLWAVDNQNLGTGWVQTGSWVLGAPVGNVAPTVVSGTPTTSTTTPQTFTFTTRDANGSANIDRIYFLVNTTPDVPVNSCHGFYLRATNGIYLYNDALTVLLGPLTPGSGGILQNSQCAINGTTSALVSGAGTDLTISLGMSLLGGYAAVSQSVYIWVIDKESNGTGWVKTSTWGVGTGPVAPTVVSGTPTNPTSSPTTFTFTTRDGNGATNMNRVYFLVNSTPSIPANSCHGFYDRPTNGIYLYNNALTVLQGPLTPGTVGTLANTQCSVNGSTSALVSASGTDLVINLGLSLLGSYATSTQNVYIWVTDVESNGTGWVKTSTWGNAGAPQAPVLVSGNPPNPTGTPQTFSFVVRDGNGFSDLNRVYFQVHTSPTVPANTCHGFYDRAANAFFLYSDNLSVLQGPLAPGSAATLANTACSLNGTTSTPVTGSGTDLTITMGLNLLGTYGAGQQKVYLWVTDNGGLGTGWVQASIWNSTTGAQTPVLAAGTPANSNSATQTFTLTARDANGFSDVNRLYFLVNSDTSIPAGSCHGFYDRASNSIFLYNDAVTTLSAPLIPGAAGSIQNSQCAINGALSSVSGSGTDVVLNLSITRQGAYATGLRNLYIWVTDNASAGTGWIQASTWTL